MSKKRLTLLLLPEEAALCQAAMTMMSHVLRDTIDRISMHQLRDAIATVKEQADAQGVDLAKICLEQMALVREQLDKETK